jgi:hypothetical protein
LEGKFSVEENIYKPVFRIVIKLIGGVCSIFDKAPDAAIKAGMFLLTVICRAVCDIADLFILILSKTVFRFAKDPTEPVQHRYSYALGRFLDKHSKNPEDSDISDTLVRVAETLWKTTDRISKSFSFSLIMTCLGVCVILLFLSLFRFFR